MSVDQNSRLRGRIFATTLVFAALLACGDKDSLVASEAASSAQNEASGNQFYDGIYTNAIIWSGVNNASDYSVLAVSDGIITYVGDSVPGDLNTETAIDLNGAFVMPGFMDNHVHFFEGGAALASVDLRTAKTPTEFINRIKAHSQNLPSGRWVLNGNWDHQQWGGELPHKTWIDEFTANNPVYVIRIDGHMALANSAALAAAEITAQTVSPEGGVIEKDKNGAPTGILKGNALNLILKKIPVPSDDELMEQFMQAQELALSLGLVKVHAVTAYPTETAMLDWFQLAHKRGLLKIRAQVSTPIESWQQMKDVVSRTGTGDQTLAWGGVKGFIDGSLGARTAWLHEAYKDEPDHYGIPLNDPDDLAGWMQAVDDAGLQMSVHALGDRGIDTVLASMYQIAGNQIAQRRYRIEHFQHPTTEAIGRLAHYGVIASMQPYHAIDDGQWAGERLEPQRLKRTYAFRSILDAGGILTFGSDWPVAPLSPLAGVYAAVTRRTLDDRNPEGWFPEQKISVVEALQAYTSTKAYAFSEEDLAGTLEVGKRADFVVLSDDPRAIDPVQIKNIGVLSTYIDGVEVFSAETE